MDANLQGSTILKVRRSDPRDPYLPFMGRTGFVNGICPCGTFRSVGRTAEAMFAGLTDHQESESCAWGKEQRGLEADA